MTPQLDELVPMQEAALLAYLSAFGIDHTISRLSRDDMAETLAQLVTIYSVSADRTTIRCLTPADLQGGTFAEGGKWLRFGDRREPIGGLAVTRTALKAAVAALKDAKKA